MARGLVQRLLDLAPVDSAERVGAPFAHGERTPPVLCGVADDSQARAVVAVAARIAAGLSAPLVLTHVTPAVPPGVSAAAAGPQRLRDLEARDADVLLDELLSQTERGVGAGWVVTTGEPAPTLEELAAREGAQLLVIGSAGKGALGALVKGSVSHHAIGHAPCPVVVVPPHVTDWPPPRPAGSSIDSGWSARPPVETRPSSSSTGPSRARTSVS